MAFAPNNISFVRFDHDVSGSVIFGLQNGTISIQTNKMVTFQTSEHKAKILAIAKKGRILSSVCADGCVFSYSSLLLSQILTKFLVDT